MAHYMSILNLDMIWWGSSCNSQRKVRLSNAIV